ncbi:MAG TPA: hypothetical protein VFO76_11790 [Candidatus Kapabacteria bacterium]|nr:hypothetical protein [Candidatus Kapabacteria bacterium]
MDPDTALSAPKKTSSEQQQEESVKKDHQYGNSQPTPARQASGVDADKDEKTSTDSTGGPDKPTA